MKGEAANNDNNSARGFFPDLEQLNNAISGADLEVIQLDPGGVEVRTKSFDVGELSVDRGSINRKLRVKGGLDAGRYGIGLFHPGARAKLNGLSVEPSTVWFSTPGVELDGYLQAEYGWTSLIVPADWVESVAFAGRASRAFSIRSGCMNWHPDPSRLRDLWTAAEAIVASRTTLERSEATAICWSVDVRNALGAVLGDFDTPDSRSESRSLSYYRTARLAESHMRERVSEFLCIDDICAELRVSRRYLEYAFVDAFGTSPSSYFRVLRLHQVRRRLRTPDAETTVTSVALAHGFTHLSLFSTQYRALFGESPSKTLNG